MPDAYSYLRFSSHAQALGDSLRRQMDAAYEYATKHNLTLRDEFTYKDPGVSAFNGTNAVRGDLSNFLDLVRGGRIKPGSYLLIEAFDRLTRDTAYKAVSLLGQLVEAGITVVTLDDEMEYSQESLKDERDLFYSVMLFARGHGESKRKSDLIAKAYEGRRKAGSKVICNIAPGWLVKDRTTMCWVLDEPRTESVRNVFATYLNGASAHATCQLANASGWPLPSMRGSKSNGWHVSLVRRILKNPAVTGLYVEKSGVEHPDFYPRVISDEEYAQAQVVSSNRSSFPRRRDHSRYNVFQGLIFCGYCGATLGYRDHGAKAEHHKSETKRYFCTAHTRSATTTCKVRPGARETQRNLLTGIFRLIADNISSDEQIAELNAKLEIRADYFTETQKRHERLLQAIEFSGDSLKSLVPKLASAESDLEQAKRDLHDARMQLTNATSQKPLDLDAVYEAITSALADLDDTPETRDALRLKIVRYVQKVYLYGREGLANVLLVGSTEPHLIIASDKGTPLTKDGGVIYRLPIP